MFVCCLTKTYIYIYHISNILSQYIKTYFRLNLLTSHETPWLTRGAKDVPPTRKRPSSATKRKSWRRELVMNKWGMLICIYIYIILYIWCDWLMVWSCWHTCGMWDLCFWSHRSHTHTLWIWVPSQRCVLAKTFWSRCILGRFRSHPPEGSTWYWAKPLSRRRWPTQNILPN